jgi:hypothetical protein
MAARALPVRLAAVANARKLESLPTGLTGAAGEYYVAAELSLLGWLATVTIKNAPATDVLARNLATGRVVAIQTKTASPGNNFRLGPKDEVPSAVDNEWYLFVGIAASRQRPDFFYGPAVLRAKASPAPAEDACPRSHDPQRSHAQELRLAGSRYTGPGPVVSTVGRCP